MVEAKSWYLKTVISYVGVTALYNVYGHKWRPCNRIGDAVVNRKLQQSRVLVLQSVSDTYSPHLNTYFIGGNGLQALNINNALFSIATISDTLKDRQLFCSVLRQLLFFKIELTFCTSSLLPSTEEVSSSVFFYFYVA